MPLTHCKTFLVDILRIERYCSLSASEEYPHHLKFVCSITNLRRRGKGCRHNVGLSDGFVKKYLCGSLVQGYFSQRFALFSCRITLQCRMLELLAYTPTRQQIGHADGVAKLFQTTSFIKKGKDWVRDAITCINVVTPPVTL